MKKRVWTEIGVIVVCMFIVLCFPGCNNGKKEKEGNSFTETAVESEKSASEPVENNGTENDTVKDKKNETPVTEKTDKEDSASEESDIKISAEDEEDIKTSDEESDIETSIPEGAVKKVEEIEDLDGNGKPEKVIYWGTDDWFSKLDFYFNGKKIFERDGTDNVPADLYEVKYEDIDHDGDREIILTMLPHVNSMPLMEYAVLKNENGEWKELEMYHTESDALNNSFPITVTKGPQPCEVVITCEGLDQSVKYDLSQHFNLQKQYYENQKNEMETSQAEDTDIRDIENWIKTVDSYKENLVSVKEGEVCGATSAWGVWNLEMGTYNDKPCLIADQGIEGNNKWDYWGDIYIYFDYDLSGKIRILKLDFIENKEY